MTAQAEANISGPGATPWPVRAHRNPVNDASHGIEAVEPPPVRRDERTEIGDWGGEHPELDKGKTAEEKSEEVHCH